METIIMSVGGSLIVPDQIDTVFLHKLKKFITSEVADNGRSFIIITGGGSTSREYGTAAAVFKSTTQTNIDEIGIAACQMNASLLKVIFNDIDIKINPDLDLYKPGSSSDRAAVRTALRHNAKKIVNLSNISHVYTADPKKNSSATKIENITWEAFRKLIPKEFTPNLSSPFDPEAAREAAKHNIEVVTISGENLEELKKYFNDESFIGTRIHN